VARLFSTGFELNSLTANVEFTNTAGTLSIVTSPSPVRSGTYALRANPAAATGIVTRAIYGADQNIVGYVRLYLYIASLPGGNDAIIRFSTTANTNRAGIRLTSGGVLQLINSSSVQVGSDSSALSTGQWYMIELRIDATTNPGTVEARLNGQVFASGSNNIQGSWARIQFGSMTAAMTADLYFDDIVVNDTTGSFQNTYPGPGRILHLYPTGAGDQTQWTIGGSTPAATNWQSVNEVTPDNAVTLVSSNTLSQEDWYDVASPAIGAGDVINVVQVGGRFNNNTADAVTAFVFQLMKASGGTVAQSASIIPNTTSMTTNSAAADYSFPITLYRDPDSINWSKVTLDTMQIGQRITAGGTNNIQVTTIWVVVDYTPSTPMTLPLMGVG
jgi:hypothetical protein